jgi:hypothetical protein
MGDPITQISGKFFLTTLNRGATKMEHTHLRMEIIKEPSDGGEAAAANQIFPEVIS